MEKEGKIMAYKILSLDNEPKSLAYKVLSLGNETQPETFGAQAKRIATATGLKGVENIESLLQLGKTGLLGVGSLFGMEDPHKKLVEQGKLAPQEYIADILQKKSGYSPEQLQPQNAAENFIQRFGSQAPLNALFSGIPALASTALGSGAAAAAGSLGAPEGLQDILQLGTEIGRGLYKGRIPTVNSAQKNAYEKAALSAGEITSKIAPIEKALGSISQKLTKETIKSVSEEVKHAFQTVEGNLDKLNGKLKVKDALDLRRKLGETYDTVSKNAKPYLNELRDSINEFFSIYSAENPQFYKHLDEADKLTQMKHMRTTVDKFADLLASSLPGVLGSSAKTFTKLFGVPTLGFLEKISRNTLNNPVARKHYFNVVKGAATQNPALFINSVRKLKSNMD